MYKLSLPEARLPRLLASEAAAAASSASSSAAADAADLSGRDLLRGVYEGGFKLWEGTHDLLALLPRLCGSGALALRGARVLEAGCGVGLAGMLAVQLGAASLVLQDFNAAVLRAATRPALRLNGLEAADVRLISGDWASVSELLSREARGEGSPLQALFPGRRAAAAGFDLILTAETIYNTEATPRLWKLLSEQLRPGGVALVAAKSYYFGVGGSVASFRQMVLADGRFECSTVATFEDGKSNRREVLKICWKAHEDAPPHGEAPSNRVANGVAGETADDVESSPRKKLRT